MESHALNNENLLLHLQENMHRYVYPFFLHLSVFLPIRLSIHPSIDLTVYCSFVYRFWNLGLEKALTLSAVVKESRDFEANFELLDSLYPESSSEEPFGGPSVSSKPEFKKPKEAVLDLIGTDTDSYTYSFKISTDSFNSVKRNEIIYWRVMYNFIYKHKSMDIDNLPLTHPLYLYNADEPRYSNLLEIKKKHKKVLGKFTTEWPDPSNFIRSVCYLKAKLYAILTTSDYEKKRMKGITRAVVNSKVDYNLYEHTYQNETMVYHSQVGFRSRKHDIFLESMSRRSMSILCQKRYWVTKNLSYPFGYTITLNCTYCRQKYSSTDKLSDHDLICLKNPHNSKDPTFIEQYRLQKKMNIVPYENCTSK